MVGKGKMEVVNWVKRKDQRNKGRKEGGRLKDEQVGRKEGMNIQEKEI